MMAKNNIISFNSHQDNLPGKTTLDKSSSAAIAACRAILKTSLPKCFDFFSNLDDSLFKLADQAKSNQEQEDYFIAMRQFRVKQDSIKTEFTNLVLSDFDNFWSHPITKSQSKEEVDELSLMQNEVLEEEIALQKIITKGESVGKAELTALTRRFSALLSSDDEYEHPLLPSQIVLHLQSVISPVTDDITIKLLSYKHFEQFSVTEFAKIYQSLNEELIKQGILPKLVLGKRNRVSPPPGVGQARNTEQTSSSSGYYPEEGNEDPAIFEELRHLLGRGDYSHTSRSSENSNTASVNTLVSVISSLQHQIDAQPSYNDQGQLVLPDLRQTLQSNLNQKQADGSLIQHSISHLDEDTLNVISLLFEFILEDRAIPAPVRALLARLQLPMLKIAISDKTFFSKKNHTARRLLNSLANVSTGWDHSNGSEDILYNQINSIVETILNNFDTDLGIFDDLNAQLDQFIAQQSQTSDVAEQRVTKATEGQEKLALSQQEVEKLINELSVQYSPVPTAVISLLEEWKKVLKLRFLQKGKESAEWQESVKLTEQLLWSVQPTPGANERQQLLTTIPDLLKTLRSNLSGPSFNQHKINTLFKELQECHIKCLSGNQIDQSKLQNVEVSAAEQQEKVTEIPKEKKILSDEEALVKANELAVGTWIELEENGQAQRMKFSWRSNLTGRCLFVTYQGLKAAELALQELANLFQQGQIEILDQSDKPLMDRALISMKETIEHKK